MRLNKLAKTLGYSLNEIVVHQWEWTDEAITIFNYQLSPPIANAKKNPG
jgi:hypothetical protein